MVPVSGSSSYRDGFSRNQVFTILAQSLSIFFLQLVSFIRAY